MSMKINTKANSRAPQKPKSNKKKLFLLFTGSFMVFFFICTFVASLLTPSIDVPALKEDGEINGVSSEDFKGRIDPRLKSIEMQEETVPVTAQTGTATKSKNVILNNTTSETNVEIPNSETNVEESIDNMQNFDDLPYDNGKTTSTESPFQPKTAPQKPAIKAPAASQIAKPSKPKENLMLREKIDASREPVTMSKVSVGNYASPAEAKRVSQELMNSNLNVTPFIKENNGSYTLQVGSFSSQEKAENLAGELRRRNMPARVSQE